MQGRGPLANNNGSLVLKVNPEAETGARVKLFIEIPWCGLSIRNPQSQESSNTSILCGPYSLSPEVTCPSACGTSQMLTLTWEVKSWKCDMSGLVNRAFWRCHTQSSQCPLLCRQGLGRLPACRPQCIESLHRKVQTNKKANLLPIILF